jgi:hypothetical protein
LAEEGREKESVPCRADTCNSGLVNCIGKYLLEKSGKRREGTENEEMQNQQTYSTHLSQKVESNEGMKEDLGGEKREIRNGKLQIADVRYLTVDLDCQRLEKNRGSVTGDCKNIRIPLI